MILAELSTNHITIDKSFSVDARSTKGDPVASRGSVSTAPSSSHDTPRTTAKTRDIGSLSVKQSRLPYPITRVSPRKYKSTFDSAQNVDTSRISPVPDLGPYTTVHGAVAASRGKNVSTASSIISMYGRDSRNNPQVAFQQTSDREYRSFSMTQSSLASYTLSNHRSYSSLRESRVLGIPARPRSPFTYPTRLKRPGFRPSSPVSSDVGGADNRNTSGLDRGSSSQASGSFSHPTRRPLGHGMDQDRCVPPSLLTPTSSVHSHQDSRGAPSSSRAVTLTLTSTSSSGNLGTFAGGSGVQILSSSTHHINGQPPPPLYYDYTEAFEDEDYFLARQTNSFPFLAIDKTIPEDHPVMNCSSAVRDEQETPERPANTGDSGHRCDHSGPAGYPKSDMGDLTNSNLTVADRFKENPKDSFPTNGCRGLETGIPLDSLSSSGRVGAKTNLEYTIRRPSNAYPFCGPDHDGGDPYGSPAFVHLAQPTVRRYQSLRIQEETEVYTRLRARRQDLHSSALKEGGLEDFCNQESSDKSIAQATNFEGGSVAMERPISSYSRRSSIRRFFSSDRGFGDLPDVVTSLEGIGRPYTPDRFLLGDAMTQYCYTGKESSNRVGRVDSASIKDFGLRHSGSTSDDGNVKRSASKLTKRTPKERGHRILTVVSDTSGINGTPQTHPILREVPEQKRRFSSTVQGDFQTAVSGLGHPNLMKQLPQLPALPSPELISFPLPPLTIPLEPPLSDIPSSAESDTLTAMGEKRFVLADSGSANKTSITNDQIRLGIPLETPNSPLSLFPSSGHVVALGELETHDTTTGDSQGANLAYKVTGPQKFKVRTKLPLAAPEVWKPFKGPNVGVAFQASSPVNGHTPKALYVTNEKMKKVSFQDARQNQLGARPPKFKLRSRAVSAPGPCNQEEATSRNEAGPRISDRNGSETPGALMSGGVALGSRVLGRDTGEMASTGRPSTSSDKITRGRSSNVGPNPSLRHANPSEPRSVFSDDSSQIVSNRNAIKRLTNLRAKLPALSASRRSRDGLGGFDRAVANLAVVGSKKDGFESSHKTVDTCKIQYEVRKLASRFGSWFNRRRERSRVVFRKGRKANAPAAKNGTLYPGV